MCKFALAIAAQKKIYRSSIIAPSNPRKRFPFGVPDKTVKSVLKMLAETNMRKTEIARAHNLTPSSVYNIRNRYKVMPDGSIDRNARNDNPATKEA